MTDSRDIPLWITPTSTAEKKSVSQGGSRGGNSEWLVEEIAFPNPESIDLYPKYNVTNNSGAGNEISLILVCYDESGRMIDYAVSTVFIDDEATEELSVRMTKPYGTETCNAFLWDENYIPISNSEDFGSCIADDIHAPENLTVSAITDVYVSFTWRDVGGAARYELEYTPENGNETIINHTGK